MASFGAAGKQHEDLPKRLLGYGVDVNKTSLAKIIETGRERIINDLDEYLKGKPEKEYNNILLQDGIRSSITFPLKNNDKVVGIIFFSSSSKNVYTNEHVEFLRTLASSIMLGLEKSIFMDDMIVGSVQALAGLAEQRDPETGEHLKRMATYSKVLAQMLSGIKKYEKTIDLDFIKNIERFSPLHDIGKVGIRDDILLKPDKLTGEEFAIMKTHTIYGAWVLRVAENNVQKGGRSIFKMAIDIAESHHEKWDGSGYPHGKSENDIPLSARIVALADVFDALTSKRPYKEAFSFEDSYNNAVVIDEILMQLHY
jgi:response regulator RpfG family c-di-GMP phosphodiesterase